MRNHALLVLTAALPLYANDMPPIIPDGPIEYSGVSYESAPEPEEEPAPALVEAESASVAMPELPIIEEASFSRGYVNLNAYSSAYTVRGLGVRDSLSKGGYSSLSASYTLPGRDLFHCGIQHRIHGEYGIIWDSESALSTPRATRFSYALSKEIFPNLVAELGYNFRHGGLEGYMAREFGGAGHHSTHDISASVSYNDHQRGFFGKVEIGAGVAGLTGVYADIEAGYRFTDIFSGSTLGADLEVSAGLAPSFGYWSNRADGIDAYRVKAALLPFTHSGSLGRDARFYIKPWVQCSHSGNNARQIHDATHGVEIVDDFVIAIGIDCGFNF